MEWVFVLFILINIIIVGFGVYFIFFDDIANKKKNKKVMEQEKKQAFEKIKTSSEKIEDMKKTDIGQDVEDDIERRRRGNF